MRRPSIASATARSRELPSELGPALVAAFVLVLVGLDVQVPAADRAEAGAVRAAEDLVGQRERDGVARPGGEVEAVVLEIGRPELLVILRCRRLVLAVVDRDVEAGVAEAAHARADEPRRRTRARA